MNSCTIASKAINQYILKFLLHFADGPFVLKKKLILDFEANSAASLNCTFFRFWAHMWIYIYRGWYLDRRKRYLGRWALQLSGSFFLAVKNILTFDWPRKMFYISIFRIKKILLCQWRASLIIEYFEK